LASFSSLYCVLELHHQVTPSLYRISAVREQRRLPLFLPCPVYIASAPSGNEGDFHNSYHAESELHQRRQGTKETSIIRESGLTAKKESSSSTGDIVLTGYCSSVGGGESLTARMTKLA